jgi:hypothetical protein
MNNALMQPRLIREVVAQRANNNYRRELEYLAYLIIFSIGFRLWMYVIASNDVLFEVLTGSATVLTIFVMYLRLRRRQAQQNIGDRINLNDIPRRDVDTSLTAPVERMRGLLRQSAQQGRIVEELADLLPRRAFERLQRSNSQRDRSSKIAGSLGMSLVDVCHEHIQIDDIEAPKSNSNNHSPLQSKSSSSDAMLCSICLEEYADGAIIVRLPCRHEYHENCVLQWMGHTDRHRNYCCPLCKQDVAVMLANPVDIENDLIPRVAEEEQRAPQQVAAGTMTASEGRQEERRLILI